MKFWRSREPEPDPEPDLGPTAGAFSGGFEPDDAGPPCDPNPWLSPEQEAYQQAQAADELDLGISATERRFAVNAAYAAGLLALPAEPGTEADPELEAE